MTWSLGISSTLSFPANQSRCLGQFCGFYTFLIHCSINGENFGFPDLAHILAIKKVFKNFRFSVHRHGTRNIGKKIVQRIDLLVGAVQTKFLSEGVPHDNLKWILGMNTKLQTYLSKLLQVIRFN